LNLESHPRSEVSFADRIEVSDQSSNSLALTLLSRQSSAGMPGEFADDVMLEVQGLFRSRMVRMHLDRELRPGETFDLDGRRWIVTRVSPAKSLNVDRRIVARELLAEAA
jgi:hypothetical protein